MDVMGTGVRPSVDVWGTGESSFCVAGVSAGGEPSLLSDPALLSPSRLPGPDPR